MAKEHAIKDYEKTVSDVLKKYSMDKINYNMNFTHKQLNTTGYHCFMIVNQLKATKILFDHEMKLMIVNEIYINDTKIINEMLGELHD